MEPQQQRLAMNSSSLQQAEWGELAPYLAGLNVSEALEDFGRLADRVLAPSHHSNDLLVDHSQLAPATETFDEHRYRNSIYSSSPSSLCYSSSPLDVSAPNSPGDNNSLYSAATTRSPLGSCRNSSSLDSHWSRLSSPVPSEHSFSYSPAFSSPSRHDSSSCSSSSSSVASSVCGDFDGRSQRRLSRKSSNPAIGKRNDRKRQNASAAERYRQKVRGRQCGLDEELEQERQRHLKLMQSFEAKLELYREFADLLAANTRDPGHDLELARLGSSSLENILERICPAQFLAQNQSQRSELERLQSHFKRVLSVAQYQR